MRAPRHPRRADGTAGLLSCVCVLGVSLCASYIWCSASRTFAEVGHMRWPAG